MNISHIKNKELSIEFWIVTTFVVVAFIFSIFDQILIPFNSSISQSVTVGGVLQYSFSLIGERFIPILFSHLVVYICYLFLHFHVDPELNKNEAAPKNVLPVYFLIFASIQIGIINVYWAALLALKLLFILLSGNSKGRTKNLEMESGFLLSSWILIVSAGFFLNVQPAIKIYLIMVIPTAIVLYFHGLKNIAPSVFDRKWKATAYLIRMLFWAILSSVLLALVIAAFASDRNLQNNYTIPFSSMTALSIRQILMDRNEEVYAAIVGFGNFFTTLILVCPIAWQTFKRRNQQKTEEIITLKTELGQSDANLNFLKSQINPHFLFNALNTLYGTALQENAERTGEGIQKLGDMMRFMLQENIEDKILLSRDIDYLNNYIALQKLRTSTTSGIQIEIQIDQYDGTLLITPMLLIPFVENAFKHGISLNQPSHIKVALQVDQQTLYFDVQNSLHTQSDRDPERHIGGIGLQNVKQRLSLLYPDQHELIIRQTAKEFFIHLRLKLVEKP